MKNIVLLSCILTCLFCGTAWGWYPQTYEESLLPQTGYPTLQGFHRTYRAQAADTLIEIARSTGLGYISLHHANPDTDPWLPSDGESILLPYAFLPPAGIQPGITINLAELRLYYVWQEQNRTRVRVYPVGIGTSGWDTPEGDFRITEKIVHPVWYPPASIRQKNPSLPSRVAAGPDNPLGEYWLGLSAPGYGIHGTSKPYGVGRRISHGCLRLYPSDIRDLFARVSVGTTVRIIRQPVKAGIKNDQLLVEVHRSENTAPETLLQDVLQQISRLPWQGHLDMEALKKELVLGRGVPTVVSR
jgi:L,D-transpeptidase ErfK/SrfK